MTDTANAASDIQTARLGVLAAMVAGDSGLAFDLVSAQMANGVDLGTVLFELLAPVQHDVGRRWQTGDYRIADEHAVTTALETVVSMIGGSLEVSQDGQHFAIVSAEGDIHSLPGRMVATYLVYHGYQVTNLGATIPSGDLGEYLAETGVDVLLMTCSATASLRGARQTIAAAHDHQVPVVVGGRAFGSDDMRARALGADGWVEDPRYLPTFLDGFAPDIAAAEAACHTSTPIAEEIPALVEALVTAVPQLAAPEARRIVGVIDAALLTGDARIITELIEWYHLHSESPDTSIDDRELLSGLLLVIPVEHPAWAMIAEAE